MRRGYDRVEGSIDRNYDEIKGVTALAVELLLYLSSFHLRTADDFES